MKDIRFKKCLLTNNNILNENDIKINKEISIEYNNKIKRIEIAKNRKVYTNKELDYTCIKIFDKDNIEKYFKIDADLIEYSIDKYKNKEIFILQYRKGNELSFSNGIILESKDIILRNSDNSIIGLNYGSDKYNKVNLLTNIISIFNNIKNYNNNNYLISEI